MRITNKSGNFELISGSGSDSFVVVNSPGNDLLPFACQMIYAELTPWTTVDSFDDEADEFTIDFQSRSCRQSKLTEDEPLECEGPVSREIKLFWMRPTRSWDEAVAACEALSAELFFRFDGTKKQLERFSTKLGDKYSFFWTGVEYDDDRGYVNLYGQNVEYFLETLDYYVYEPWKRPWTANADGITTYYEKEILKPSVCYKETYPV